MQTMAAIRNQWTTNSKVTGGFDAILILLAVTLRNIMLTQSAYLTIRSLKDYE